ncbi:MAG: HAMP domain-containing histidine kinase [Anaerolineaceae bacterium]|nr:HAMP domain-containing histidine kinase [Anaerolineaceae bacterium]
MMLQAIVIVLLIGCLSLLFYLWRGKKEEKEWLKLLQRYRAGNKEKIFSRHNGVPTDIAFELNRIIGENQEEFQQFKKADQANKLLLTSLSHDVRTPLASLLGYLEALDKGTLDSGETEEYISVAYRKANDLKAYIDTLFDWFKLNSQEQQYQLEAVEINEYTREILIEWLPVFEQSQITLNATIPESDFILFLDKFAYTRIINNLLQNAIKHGHCSEIHICVEKNTASVLIQVGNNGKAIPADQMPYIFGRLYKGDAARSDRGSGLGLAIVDELVRGLDGEISVSRSDETNTVFCIKFPYKK